jgi:hypothetical protein
MKAEFFEESKFPLLIKAVFVVVAYIFLLEPILFDHVFSKTTFSFVKNHLGFYVPVVIIATSGFGWLYGQLKEGLIGIADIIVATLCCYSLWLINWRYETSNQEISKLCIGSIFFFPITSLISNYTKQCFARLNTNIYDRKNNSESDPNQIRIVPDLSLNDLELHSLVSKKIIDSQTLNNYPLAETVFQAIQNIEPAKKAFAIGINGSWGSGKSSLIDFIRDLCSDHAIPQNSFRKYKVVDFCPWLYPDESSLVKNFFKQISDEMEDLSLQQHLNEYATLLTEIEISGLKINNPLFLGKRSLEELKNLISKKFLASNILYVVIIDDLDRLLAKEIIEVAKLCRMLANFPRIIYLLAYDRAYIDLLLKDELKDTQLNKGETYFDKIVQLEFTVPEVTEIKLDHYLEKLIMANSGFIESVRKDTHPRKHQKFYHLPLGDQIREVSKLEVYQRFLPTIRDVNRFVNGFLLKFKSVSKSYPISITECLFLDLIFYKYKKEAETFYSNRKEFYTAVTNYNPYNKDQAMSSHWFIMMSKSFSDSEDKDQIELILACLFKDMTPSNVLELIDNYFSYYGLNTFSKADAIQFINQITPANIMLDEKIRQLFESGFAVNLISHYCDISSDYVINGTYAEDIFLKQWEDIFERFSRNLKLSNIQLAPLEIEALSDKFSEIDVRLGSKITPTIISCRNLLKGFSVAYPTFKGDEISVTLSQQNRPNPHRSFRERDDHFFDFVMDLSINDWEISFPAPTKKIGHWRMGFMFSVDNYFPLRAFRHPLPWPIFHLKVGDNGISEDGRIRVTAYDANGLIINNPFFEAVSILCEGSIKIILSRKNNGSISIWNDHQVNVNYPYIMNYPKFRVFAWWDNHLSDDNRESAKMEISIRKIQESELNKLTTPDLLLDDVKS